MYSFVGTISRYGQIERGDLYPTELPTCPNCKDKYFYLCERCGWMDEKKWYLSYFNKKHYFHVKEFTGPESQVNEKARKYLLANIGKIPRIWSLLPGRSVLQSS